MHALIKYVVKRSAQAIPLLMGVIALNFILIHIAPGDPILYMIGEVGATPEYVEMMTERLALDKPVHEQLFAYYAMVLRGDLGYSFIFNQPVSALIAARIPATLLLVVTQLVLFSIVGVILGVISSTKPYSLVDNSTTILALIGYSIPVFWLGQMMILTFAIRLNWFPVGGMISMRTELVGIDYIIDVLHHLVLPCFTLGVALSLCLVTRLTRANMLEVLSQDYIITARAKGLKERVVLFKHALRNALLPVVTIVGFSFGYILAGAVLTETVFAWPGLGRLMYEALACRDYPVLMGMFLVISIMVILANLVTDIVYTLIDPRIRHR